MEHLSQLLMDLERITFQDIAKIPEPQQHLVVERLEELQDELRELVELEGA